VEGRPRAFVGEQPVSGINLPGATQILRSNNAENSLAHQERRTGRGEYEEDLRQKNRKPGIHRCRLLASAPQSAAFELGDPLPQ